MKNNNVIMWNDSNNNENSNNEMCEMSIIMKIMKENTIIFNDNILLMA